MILHQQLSVPKAPVKRYFCGSTVLEGHLRSNWRDRILRNFECQILKVDLEHISHDFFALNLLWNNDTRSNIFAGLLCVEAKCAVFACVPDKCLRLPKTVCTTLPTEPDQRPVLWQFRFCSLCNKPLVKNKVLLIVSDMGIYKLGQFSKYIYICLFSHVHHSNPISCFLALAGGFRFGCVFAAALS